MRRILVLALACLLTFLPVAGQASWYKETPEELVRWAGCTAAVKVEPSMSAADSYYRPSSHTIFIGSADDAPEYVKETILFHETGHCLQAQQPGGFAQDRYQAASDLELEADWYAANLECARHRPGIQYLRDVMQWAHDTFDYDGDWMHGSLEQRMHAGDNAPSCQTPEHQGA